MKRHINLWLVMFLAISLALPIYSMAQTTKLTLESSSGDRIWGANVKTFSLGADNTLVIYLDGPFDFRALYPDISVDDTSGTYAYCAVSSPASVTATQGVTLSFKLKSLTANAQFSPIVVNPEDGIATFDTSTKMFTWPTGGSSTVPTGSYLAVFEATVGADKSQLVVMIKINPPETVTAPTVSGPSTGAPGVSYQFTASGSTSDLNHAIEYQFDWGDGNQSVWSASPQSHSWGTASTTPYTITAKARCVDDYVESTGVGTASITISNIPTYTVTVSVVNSAGGSVNTTSVSGIASGGQAIFNVTVTSGYTASVSAGALSGTTGNVTWTFTTVTSNISATINFTQLSGGGGSGALGTKTNPIPMNLYGGRGTTYGPSIGTIVPLKANEKKWFVVDSLAATGRSVTSFTFCFKEFNNANLVHTKVPQSKATGQDLGTEVRFFGLEPTDTVNNNQPYNLNDIKYLYAIQNNGPTTTIANHPELSVYFSLP